MRREIHYRSSSAHDECQRYTIIITLSPTAAGRSDDGPPGRACRRCGDVEGDNEPAVTLAHSRLVADVQAQQGLSPRESARAAMVSAETAAAAPKHAIDQAVALERSLLGSATGYAEATNTLKVPVIDLNSPDAAEQMWQAASTVGFFTITNHGIPQSAIDEAFAVSGEFFGQDKEAKYKASPFAKNMNSGYEFMEQVLKSPPSIRFDCVVRIAKTASQRKVKL
eukprot:1485138-Pleurochrysis_carterae.AAC.1